MQGPHKFKGCDSDATSQMLTSELCSQIVDNSPSWISCDNVNFYTTLPDKVSDVISFPPGQELDENYVFDILRRIPEIHSDDSTPAHLGRMPGSTPDAFHNTPRFEPYNVSHPAIKEHVQMVETMWPTFEASAASEYPEFGKIYGTIKDKALPNFLGAKIPVPSGLKIDKWKDYLHHYHDKVLCEFLQFGWPLGYRATAPPLSVTTNHPSAQAHISHVHKYIKTELDHDALLGPFSAPSFTPWVRISPLMTRSKKDSSDRRIIVDLSFPTGSSVNDGIDPANHLGKDISYSLPTITDLITRVQGQGSDCYLWKADLTRAYRQLRADPLDVPLLGIQVGSEIYLDRCPPFGCRSSASICQRVANAIVYIMAQEGHYVMAYLDDFGGCHASYAKAKAAYDRFNTLADELGLQLAHHKSCPPAKLMNWLGYEVDTHLMTVTIPPSKLQEILHECKLWLTPKHATKKMIQQIAGKLVFLCNCVQQARKFMVRILAALRNMGDREWTTIDRHFKADIAWFCKYAEQANGVLLCTPAMHYLELECDSSLYGAGGNTDQHYYIWIYTNGHRQRFTCIYQLEAVNIVVAYKTLINIPSSTPTHVTIWTDNINSSFALHTGRTKDEVLGSCARELWLHASKANQTIEIRHKKGTLLPLADALSRLSNDKSKQTLARQIINQRGLRPLSPKINNYNFFDAEL